MIREEQLTFVKAETTADDLLLLLDTLWTRAEDVQCAPQVRFSVHWALVLAGFGFRPGELMNTLFKHVQLLVVRDEENPNQKTLVAEITVIQAKRQRADPGAPKSDSTQERYRLLILQADSYYLLGY